jgi:hypothetical protein
MRVILERVAYPSSKRSHWRVPTSGSTICGLPKRHPATGFYLYGYGNRDQVPAICNRCALVLAFDTRASLRGRLMAVARDIPLDHPASEVF